ncbi:MAG: Lrp/AsnC family transcriptional regulator [Trueperaceae bacterium]|nr:Lrp/AsnC family transcriptional regulator [Trueperaceae bacterium]
MQVDELRPNDASVSLKYQELDETDQRIVDFLRVDGRMPFREIARKLDVSESMVRKRVNRLLESGWMRILAISNPLQLGVPILATTYATVSPQHLDKVTDELAKLDSVRYVAIGVGGQNVVIESIHASNAEVHEFIQREMTREGVVKSETILVVKIKKSIWDWKIREPEKE